MLAIDTSYARLQLAGILNAVLLDNVAVVHMFAEIKLEGLKGVRILQLAIMKGLPEMGSTVDFRQKFKRLLQNGFALEMFIYPTEYGDEFMLELEPANISPSYRLYITRIRSTLHRAIPTQQLRITEICSRMQDLWNTQPNSFLSIANTFNSVEISLACIGLNTGMFCNRCYSIHPYALRTKHVCDNKTESLTKFPAIQRLQNNTFRCMLCNVYSQA